MKSSIICMPSLAWKQTIQLKTKPFQLCPAPKNVLYYELNVLGDGHSDKV